MSDSRYVFVGTSAQKAPSQCLLSGQTANLVDTGRYIVGYGQVYLSADTIAELASVSGYTPPVDVLLQRTEWYNKGVEDTLKKEYDVSLRTLAAEFSAAAARLELALGLDTSEDGEPGEEGAVEPTDSGDDLGTLGLAKPGDERASDSARGGKKRGSVQRPRIDDAFAI